MHKFLALLGINVHIKLSSRFTTTTISLDSNNNVNNNVDGDDDVILLRRKRVGGGKMLSICTHKKFVPLKGTHGDDSGNKKFIFMLCVFFLKCHPYLPLFSAHSFTSTQFFSSTSSILYPLWHEHKILLSTKSHSCAAC
jgi:hypothetical protein